MTKPWRVDVLECRGSSYDVGKQTAEGFLKTSRGRAFARRKERRPFAFSLKNAEATLKTYAANIWEELHGLADGLKIPLERAVAEYSNGRLRYPPRGCSAVMTAGLYGRNYDYDARRYDKMLIAIQPKGVHASIGFSERFTGRVDGMNEHGLCVGLHQVNHGSLATGPRLHADRPHGARPVRHDARRGQAVAKHSARPWLQLFAHGRKPARRPSSRPRRRRWPCTKESNSGCSNHFRAPALQAYNRRNPGSCRHLPPLEEFARQRPPADTTVQFPQQLPVAGLRPSLQRAVPGPFIRSSARRLPGRCWSALAAMPRPQSIDLGELAAGRSPRLAGAGRPVRRHRETVRSRAVA